MQGEQNNIVKQQLIREIKQFSSRQHMIPYYMSYDFPQKQRGVKGWWQDLIQNIIRKKNQIYIIYKDLQTITTINGLKPLPIKPLLKQFKIDYVFVKQQDLTLQKKPQKKVKPWYTSILNFAWNNNKQNQPEFPFTYQPQQKIISINANQRKKKQFTVYLHKQFEHQNFKFKRTLVTQASWVLRVDRESVQILLRQLRSQKQLVIVDDENFGDQIIIFNADRKKMSDQNFIKIEKIKCSFRGSLERFDLAYEKSSSKIANLRQKAKDAVRNNDKNKAKVIVAQMKKQQDHRQKIQVQKQVLQLKINQIQVNQMNKSSLQLLNQAQLAYKQVAVDQERFQQVIQRARQIQMQTQQNTKKFQELAASQQVQDEVDDMMKQIQAQISQTHKIVQPKRVNVIITQQNQNQGQKIKQMQLN